MTLIAPSIAVIEPLTIDLLASRERPAAAAIWRDLEATIGSGLTNSWTWIATWLDHYGDLVPHRFAIAADSSGPRAAALLTSGVGQTRGPVPVRTLHLGTAGEPPADTVWVEYNRPLVADADRIAFAAALLRTVRSSNVAWDVFQLDGVVPEIAEAFGRIEPRFDLSRRFCHVVDLRQFGGADPFPGFRRETVAKIRKNRRRFDDQFGPLTTCWSATVDDALTKYRALIPLHQARWERVGEPGCFASARFAAFHEAIIQRLMPTGQIVLVETRAGERPLGVFYGFVEHGVVYHYQWGLHAFEQNSLSPGFVVGAACMEEAARRGLRELNWLAGEVRYKRELANSQRELVWAELRRGPRMRAIGALQRARAWRHRRRGDAAPVAHGEG